jgi:hypothetical protein
MRILSCSGKRTRVLSIAPALPGQIRTNHMSKQSNNSVSLRRAQFIASWREYAPAATFSNLTLAQFETETQKPLDVRSRMTAVRTQLTGMKIERDQADEVQGELFVSVANAIRGNPDFGLNSPLYRSLGFVPKAERKRPQRAVKKDAAATKAPPADADAA